MEAQQDQKLQALLRKHKANLLLDSVRSRVAALPPRPKSLPAPAAGSEDPRVDIDTDTSAQMREVIDQLTKEISSSPAVLVARDPTSFTCVICNRGKQAEEKFWDFTCGCAVCSYCVSKKIYEELQPECPSCEQKYRHHELMSFLNHISRPPR